MIENTNKNIQTGLEIAVIGMAGRFPGAGNIEEFWDNLKKGIESVYFYTEEELKTARISPELLTNPNYVRSAGGVLENTDCFDASFFGYLPGEAEIMDPQSRIFHECAWAALEDAGYNPNAYNGMIGIYAGASNDPLWEISVLLSCKDKMVGEYNAAALSNKEFLCLWIAYKLNLKGPAVEINTSCSTSLVAIHTACRALWTKECDIALAGGVSIRSFQISGYLYHEGMITSADGHCRAFDANATGTITGNGAGVVVLKKLKEAINDKDNIYAVIKGTAINNDGTRKAGFTAPSCEGQSNAIKTALHISRVEPESIGYIETHGTGTIIGDPIEIEALNLAFNTAKKNYCAVGSVKTNIGHLDAAAGAAGFIKTVLALKHRQIPPSLHFQIPNPKIDFHNSPFFVNKELKEWKRIDGYPLRAGVSSFGIGGTNAHAVLEEYDAGGDQKPFYKKVSGLPKIFYYLLPISARTQSALDKMTENLAEYLNKNPGIKLADTAYTLSAGREVFEYRKTVVCADLNEAVNSLASASQDKVQTFYTKDKDRPVVFMFPGQGAQYINMGLGLYNEEGIFQQEMDRCFEILKPLIQYDLKEILYPINENMAHKAHEVINQTEITQPAIFCFEYALARLLMSWNIKPYAMIGHSIGEYAAACLSGVFSLADALRLTVLRGRLMQTMPPGAMLSVSLPVDELEPLLSPGISLAAVNSSSLCVVSGHLEAVEKFETRLKEMRYTSRRLHTSHAFHSSMMDPILTEFEENVRQTPVNKPTVPFISNVTGQWISNEKATNPGYWAKHLRETVNFRDGLSLVLENKKTIFIEVGPGDGLCAFLRQHKDKKADHFAINMVRHPRENIPDDGYLYNKIGQLWLYGVTIDWTGLYSQEQRYRISLPTYPFERQRFQFNTRQVLADLKNRQQSTAPSVTRCGSELKEPGKSIEMENSILYPRPQLTKSYTEPQTEIQVKLANLWQNFFGIKTIGIHDDFFELGGDSLKAITIISRINKELNMEIPLAEFFNRPTIEHLAVYIEPLAKKYYMGLLPVEKKEYYQLSSAQKRLYILQQMNLSSTAYSLPGIIPLPENIHVEKLEDTFKKLIKRHESLRTSFHMVNNEPAQRIHDEVEFKIENVNPTANEFGHFIRPFDLSQSPLLRVGLVLLEENKHLLLVDMHHIITDGTSQELLKQDFIKLYNEEDLPPLRIQYKDFAGWQNCNRDTNEFKKHEQYWLKEFEGEIPVLNIPTDFPRPDIQSFEGNIIDFQITQENSRLIKEYALKQGATLYMVLLAAVNILLSKLSGREDIVIGTPAAGRRHADLEKIIGMFVNTLVLQNYPTGEKTYREFLTEIKKRSLEAFENQAYQFEDLVEKVAGQRDLNRNPLFDVLFVLQNMDRLPIGGFKNESLEKKYGNIDRTSKLDLTITAWEEDRGMNISFRYCTGLFKKESIERFMKYFYQILLKILAEPGIKIKEIDIIPEEEKNRILYEFNATEADYPKDKILEQLFEEQVERTPDNIAAVGGVSSVGGGRKITQITYRDLSNRATHIATLLRVKNAARGTIVGIMVKPILEMVTSIIGVLKAGSAFLPIEPESPVDRKNYVLNDSRMITLLTQSQLRETFNAKVDFVNIDDPDIYKGHNQKFANDCTPADPVYVIYTTGTTGNPKGVLINNQNLVNYVGWFVQTIHLAPEDSGILTSSFAFDALYTQFFSSLLTGCRIHVIPRETFLIAERLLNYFRVHQISYIKMTPSLFNLIASNPGFSAAVLKKIRFVMLGGEEININDVEKAHTRCPHLQIMNHYGPTETTIGSIARYLDFDKFAEYKIAPTIGKPLFNTKVYILDKAYNIVPIGVVGDLFIGGDGVGMGYLNKPELTADRFNRSYRTHRNYILYKTGDLARWRPDGNVEFLGRIDNQVKIRGIRIELGEIQCRLMNHPQIKDAVVVAKEKVPGEKHLYAYIACRNTADIDNTLSVNQLRDYLSGSLPGYMIPSYFIRVDKIPLTANGKIDRKALNSIGIEMKSKKEYAEPRNEVEQKIAQAWKEVLKLEEVGIYENFYDLGGTSMDIIKLNAKYKELFEEEETIVQVLRHPTVHSFGEYLAQKRAGILSNSKIQRPVHINKMKQALNNQKAKRIKGGISNG